MHNTHLPAVLPSTAALLAVAVLLPSAASAEVELTNGDILEATVVPTAPQTDDDGVPLITLDHESMGRITVPASSVVPDPDNPAGAGGGAASAANKMGEVIDSILFPGWDKSLSAGFSGTNGNTDTLSLYANFATGIKDERRRWDIKADYFRKTDTGDAIESNLIARATRDWLIPEKDYFYFAKGTFEYDQFESWEQRVGLFGGVGYQFIETDKHDLVGRVGVGALYEFGGAEDFTVEALIGVEYIYQISANQQFGITNTYHPSLDPVFDQYRNITEAYYKVAIAAGKGASLKLGIYNEYQSEVDEGLSNNDLKYYGALSYDF